MRSLSPRSSPLACSWGRHGPDAGGGIMAAMMLWGVVSSIFFNASVKARLRQ